MYFNKGHAPHISLKQAAGIAGVSPDTVARWCKRYGIGKQLHPNAPWRVDRKGLEIVAAGDAQALAAFQREAMRGMPDFADFAEDAERQSQSAPVSLIGSQSESQL